MVWLGDWQIHKFKILLQLCIYPYILEISAHYHDSAAALVVDGEIVAAASEVFPQET
jgi:hypothetical protein